MRKRPTARHNSYYNWPVQFIRCASANAWDIHQVDSKHSQLAQATANERKIASRKLLKFIGYRCVCALFSTTTNRTTVPVVGWWALGKYWKYWKDSSRNSNRNTQHTLAENPNINLGIVNVYADELLFFGRQNIKHTARLSSSLGFQRTHLIWMHPNFSSFSPIRCLCGHDFLSTPRLLVRITVWIVRSI